MIPLILTVFAFVLLVIAGILASQPESAIWWRRFLCYGLACWVFAEILSRGASLPVFQQIGH